MATRKKSPAVTRKNKNLPSQISLIEDASSGFEEADKDAFAIPFLAVLQKLSPQVDTDDALHIKGAKPGMVFNTVTEELYRPPFSIVPVKYIRQFIEWIPRNQGGGFVQMHSIAEHPKYDIDENFNWVLENGNELKDHRNHFLILAKTLEPALISMTSSQLKKSRKWMSQMQALKVTIKGKKYTPPMFYSLYNLTIVKEENEKGKWFGWKINRVGDSTEEQYKAAKEFKSQIEAGVAKAEFDKTPEEEEAF